MKAALRSVVLRGSGVSYTAEAQTLFAAMSTPPSDARKSLINTLIAALQTAGVWDKLDLLYILAAADSQAAGVNWKDPATFTASVVNAPAFVADRGYTGAATKYLDTTFNPATGTPNYARDSATIGGWSRKVAADNGVMLGTTDAHIWPRYTDNLSYVKLNQAAFATYAATNGSGSWVVSRTGASVTDTYRNGVSVGATSPAASIAVASRNMYVLGMNNGAGMGNPWTGECAAAWFGGGLSAAEALALHNAVSAYMTAVGAA